MTGRREFVLALLGGASGLRLTTSSFAQAPISPVAAPSAPITVTKLTESVAVCAGDGGNVGLLLGVDGLVLVDGGLATRAAELARAVGDIDGRAVQVLINSHYHFDHVGSNELLGRQAAPGRLRIVAHQNVAARLSQRFANEAFGRTFEPLAPEGLPTDTFTRSGRLAVGNETIEYVHVPLAHTDGDSYVFLPGSNILQTGDLLWIGRYPVVDYSAGGTLAGMISAVDRLMNVGDAGTRVIPGHGPVVGKAEMRATRDIWATINERVDRMMRAGRMLEEVLAAAPTREFDAQLGTATRDSFIRQTYGGLATRITPAAPVPLPTPPPR
ncbi:MAG: MBL fold metallo-hydrolase [Vicinamibacterales bacterium]